MVRDRSARGALAEVILSFQAPNGGWSKHVDFSLHVRQQGESYFAESADWEWISTIDNGATTEEIRFLSRVDNARSRTPSTREAIRRGVDYLLASQFPNGCFPQVYPLQGSYHDAATFNDDATINVLWRVCRTSRKAISAEATLDAAHASDSSRSARGWIVSSARRSVDGRVDRLGTAARSADIRASERAELRAGFTGLAGERGRWSTS